VTMSAGSKWTAMGKPQQEFDLNRVQFETALSVIV